MTSGEWRLPTPAPGGRGAGGVVNQPGCTTMSAGKRPPGHQQMSALGDSARSPLVVLSSICTYMREFSLQLIPAAPTTVTSSLQFVPETPEWPLHLRGTGFKIQPLNFPTDCFVLISEAGRSPQAILLPPFLSCSDNRCVPPLLTSLPKPHILLLNSCLLPLTSTQSTQLGTVAQRRAQVGGDCQRVPRSCSHDTKQSFPDQCLTHLMVQFWGLSPLPSVPTPVPLRCGTGNSRCTGREEGMPLPHPATTPLTASSLTTPSMGYPAGYSQNVTPHPTSDLMQSSVSPNQSPFGSEGSSLPCSAWQALGLRD